MIYRYLAQIGLWRVLSNLNHDLEAFFEGPELKIISAPGLHEMADEILDHYEPSPVVSPWCGSSFGSTKAPAFPASKLSRKEIIGAFLATQTKRLEPLRKAIRAGLKAIKETSSDIPVTPNQKPYFLRYLRDELDPDSQKFIDLCLTQKWGPLEFNTLAGMGGGNNGNWVLSDTYLKALWITIPEIKAEGLSRTPPKFSSRNALEDSIRGLAGGQALRPHAVESLNMSLYGRLGFLDSEGENPWDVIFAVEGLLALSSDPDFGNPLIVEYSHLPDELSMHEPDLAKMKRRFFMLPFWREPASFLDFMALAQGLKSGIDYGFHGVYGVRDPMSPKTIKLVSSLVGRPRGKAATHG